MKSGEFYKASGKFNPAVVVGVPIFAVLSMAYALIYAYVDVYIPIVGYLSLIFVVVFTALNIITTYALLQFFKVRNKFVVLAWGVMASVVAVYFDWACFLYVLINKSLEDGDSVGFVELVFSPEKVWNGIQMVAETGWYSLRSAQINGGVLWTFWGIEALIVIGGNLLIAFGVLDEVFCENCSVWTEKKENVFTFTFADEESLIKQFSTAESLFANSAENLTSETALFYKIDANVCKTCEELIYLSLGKCELKVDKSGEQSKDETNLVKNISYSVDDFRNLARAFGVSE